MDLMTVVLIAIGLSADAVAVALSGGLAIRCFNAYTATRISLYFGGFQALMPVMGWLAGISVSQSIAAFDHWIAFALLGAIGSKMIYEAVHEQDEAVKVNYLDHGTLTTLAVATSIDALAVGLSLATLQVDILKACSLIGVITFLLCFIAVFVGCKFGKLFGSRLEIAGGVTLIGIGLKILIEHLTAVA
jgi:putative Mn2+ efflux pump MntP